MTKIFRDN